MKNTAITFRLNEREKQKLEMIAKLKDVPVSQLIREAIRNTIQKEDKE